MTETLEEKRMEIPDTFPAQPFRFELSPRWIRTYFANVALADSKRVKLLHEPGHVPVYYFPMEDVRTDLLIPTDHRSHSPLKGEASYWTVQVGERSVENAVWEYRNPPPDGPGMKDYIAFSWDAMDAWYEEDDEVFVHARDPYHRVDVLHSSRHVQVVVAGETIADTRRPRLLFETNLPTRYYIPKHDVRLDLLEPSDTTTSCPYKGNAVYWSVRVGDAVANDLVWSYPFPIPECSRIEQLLCFFNERADIYVDGELQPKPRTRWS